MEKEGRDEKREEEGKERRKEKKGKKERERQGCFGFIGPASGCTTSSAIKLSNLETKQRK